MEQFSWGKVDWPGQLRCLGSSGPCSSRLGSTETEIRDSDEEGEIESWVAVVVQPFL